MKTNTLFFVACLCLWSPFMMAQVNFSNQSNVLVNSNLTSGVAIGVVDMNGDGLDDLVRLDNARDLEIEYQQANGSFSRFDYGNVGSGSEWAICIADVDNNGFRDVLTGGAYNGIKLLTANTTGTNFSSTNLSPPSIFVQGTNFADIDNNGTIDIFACHDDGLSAPFNNNGSGSFSYDLGLIDASSTIASDNSGNYGSVWTDYDNDGDLDMYLSKCRLGVSNPLDGRRVNMLFQNDGNGNYIDVAEAAGLRPLGQSWAADFADIDNDGDLDCFVINHDIPSNLYLNNGNGTFTDITNSSGMSAGITAVNIGIQIKFEDFDNDGFVDLLYTGRSGAHRLFMNNGDLTFNTIDPFATGGLGIQSAAVGDLNQDGFPDVLAAYATGFNSPSNNADHLFINNGNANNYLNVSLQGTSSNRDGIGARLAIYGTWGQQIREVRSGESYGVMNSLTQHFGLGTATVVDRLVIKWPSGTEDIICNPNINQLLTIVEGNSPSMVGASCNDGNANTNNDVIQADGCTCMGTSGGIDCNDINIVGGAGNITVSGLNAPIVIVKVFDANWQTVFDCTDTCDDPQIVTNLSEGTYYVSVKFFTATWSPVCEETGFYAVTNGSNPCDNNGGDADNDGVCANEDCDDTDPNLPMPVNTTCDDGDTNTENDVIQADGCTCAGTPIGDPCANAGGDADNDGICANEDCDDTDPNLPIAVNTPCDDGDTNTENDVIQADGCTCAGTPIGDPCANAGGDADNDGICANEDCDDTNPNFPMPTNTPCDDGDANTINDVIQADGCTCAGTPDTGEPDCNNVVFDGANGNLSISNIVAPIAIVKVFDSAWQTVAGCSNNCNATEVYNNLPEGTYYVSVRFFTAFWSPICETTEFVEISSGTGGSSIVLNCPNNISTTQNEPNGRVVSWDVPMVSTDCTQGTANLIQTVGLTSGSIFPVGATTITYQASDPCGSQVNCSFVVTVNPDGSTEPPTGYCAASGAQPWTEWIASVGFVGIDNESFKEGYGDFTDNITTVTRGQNYTITLTPGYSWTTYNEYWRVWIDYNRDGDFEDAGEKAFEGSGTTVLTGSIAIPSTADTGPTRMRVAMKNGAYATPCEAFDLGEVEDYTLNLIAANENNLSEINTRPSDWSLYPNPTTDEVYLNRPQENREAPIQVLFMDAVGRIIREVEWTDYSSPINISDLPAGMYWVLIKTQGRKEIQKLVISR